MLEHIRNKSREFSDKFAKHPKVCVVSREYYNSLRKENNIQRTVLCDKVYGLTIIITEKPNTLEVY